MKRCINTLAAAVAVFAGAAVHAESYFDPTYGIEWSYSVNSDNNTATIDGAYRNTTTDPYSGYPNTPKSRCRAKPTPPSQGVVA